MHRKKPRKAELIRTNVINKTWALRVPPPPSRGFARYSVMLVAFVAVVLGISLPGISTAVVVAWILRGSLVWSVATVALYVIPLSCVVWWALLSGRRI
jgi:hypothetical protein